MNRGLAAVAVSFLVLGSVAGAGPHRGHKPADCRPTHAQRTAATDFVRAVKVGTYRYVDVKQAVLDGYASDGKPTNAVMHYDSKGARSDGVVLDPKRPESLVYTNTYEGPRLIGVLFSMGGSKRPGPRFGGCLTEWHSHTMCKPPVGPTRPATEGTCPAGSEMKRTGDMIHTWVVPMRGGPYAHRADNRYRCWLKSLDC